MFEDKEFDPDLSLKQWDQKWILDENKQVVKADLLEWGKFLDKGDRRVALTDTSNGSVSTVFLGLNHNWELFGPPLLFETMIFGGSHDQFQERYSTWSEAEEGHQRAVDLCEGRREE